MPALPLDSDRWAKLRHAYGPAADLPGLLRSLPSAPSMTPKDDDPWYLAWSMLCHQFTVYGASYAAVPHLVAMASAARGERRAEFLSLVGSIETFRHLPGAPRFPTGLKTPYDEALREAKSLAIAGLDERRPEASLRELLGVLAAVCGRPKLAAGILMGSDEFNCSACDSTEKLPGYAEFDA